MYTDLWLTSTRRKAIIASGFASENIRELPIRNDDDTLRRFRCSVNEILKDNGLYASFEMNNNFDVIALPKSSDTLVAQSGEVTGEDELFDLKLEYIHNEVPCI